jgi:hypothetical protein
MLLIVTIKVVASIETVPGKDRCSIEKPTESGGSRSDEILSDTSLAVRNAMVVSVPIGRCGPCCSRLPMGIIDVFVRFEKLLISSHVWSGRYKLFTESPRNPVKQNEILTVS